MDKKELILNRLQKEIDIIEENINNAIMLNHLYKIEDLFHEKITIERCVKIIKEMF